MLLSEVAGAYKASAISFQRKKGKEKIVFEDYIELTKSKPLKVYGQTSRTRPNLFIKLKPPTLANPKLFKSVIKALKTASLKHYNKDTNIWEIGNLEAKTVLGKLTNCFKNVSIPKKTQTLEDSGVFNKGFDLLKNLTPDLLSYSERVAYDKMLKMLKTEPLDYQIKVLLETIINKKHMLALDMGLGKTFISLMYFGYLKELGEVKKALVLCGVGGVKYNWIDEVKKHTKYTVELIDGINSDKKRERLLQSEADIAVVNLEFLTTGKAPGSNSKTIYPSVKVINELAEKGMQLIIFDEAHALRQPSTKKAKQALNLHAKYKLLLSGSFVVNSFIDLYVPFRLVGEENSSFYSFQHKFCVLGGFKQKEIVGFRNINQLTDKLNHCAVALKKEQVLDLPDKIYNRHYCELTEIQNKLLAIATKGLIANKDTILNSANPLVHLALFRHITGCPEMLPISGVEAPQFIPAKFLLLQEIIEQILIENPNDRILLFSVFAKHCHWLHKNLSKYKPLIITGSFKMSERHSILEKFKNTNENKIIIGTIGAIGTGLTITEANHVIFYDEPWTYAYKSQATDRVHRIGQNKTVHVHTLITKNSIDEKVSSVVSAKQELTKRLMQNIVINLIDDMERKR